MGEFAHRLVAYKNGATLLLANLTPNLFLVWYVYQPHLCSELLDLGRPQWLSQDISYHKLRRTELKLDITRHTTVLCVMIPCIYVLRPLFLLI